MQTTPNYGWQIPSDNDTDLMDSDLWTIPIKAIDTAMKSLDTAYKNADTALDNRLKKFDTTTPSDVGNTVTADTNWTLDSISLYKIGKFVYGYFSATRKNSAVAGVATGNITNTPICTLPANYRPIVDCTWAGGGGLSNAMYNGMIQTTGILYVTVALPNVGFAIGDTVGASFFFLVP